MKSEFFYNKVSDRKTRITWEEEGSLDGTERARIIAKDILSNYKPNFIDKEIEEKILKNTPGIVQNWLD
jgi:trimethylamine--corrinoid protein Co-methyltransferase